MNGPFNLLKYLIDLARKYYALEASQVTHIDFATASFNSIRNTEN